MTLREFQDPDYVGDGVYVGHDGYQVWVQTDQGDCIALEPSVMVRLRQYVERVQEKYRVLEGGESQ